MHFESALPALVLLALGGAGIATAQTVVGPVIITPSLLREAGVIPDVVSNVALEPGLNFDIKYGGDIQAVAGTLISKNTSAHAPQVNISGQPNNTTYYTLLMVDPDARPDVPGLTGDIWHWGVINAPNGDFANGTTLTPYLSPGPPKPPPHRYTLVVYKQSFGTYSPPVTVNPNNITTRFNFTPDAYAAKYHLGLPVAINWFNCGLYGGI